MRLDKQKAPVIRANCELSGEATYWLETEYRGIPGSSPIAIEVRAGHGSDKIGNGSNDGKSIDVSPVNV